MTRDFSQIGYCTNVHAGASVETTLANLQRYALAVKQRVSPRGPMGVGLWLSAPTAQSLLRDRRVQEFRDWLGNAGLVPYTLNGFPHGDFHQDVVKHRVYFPTWWEDARREYTLDLIALQHAFLPEGMAGSISTLPLAWGQPRPTHDQLQQAAANLRTVADRLRRLERETGRFICLALEPEPGCFLQRSRDVVRFFHDYLWRAGDLETIRRYICVCHDVCHAAVMFEPQDTVFQTYRTAAIEVGKVQVSAAVSTPALEQIGPESRRLALTQLANFHEERYLHQTVIQTDPLGEADFFEDLPQALAAQPDFTKARGQWRVHFHVPIYVGEFGHLLATRGDIINCLKAARKYSSVKHFEVETYAWGVLPEELRQADLAAGIAEELTWFLSVQDAAEEQT